MTIIKLFHWFWRKKAIHYLRKNACPAALTTVVLTTEIRSMNISHVGHGPASGADLIIMEKIEVCKKRVVKEKN